MVSNFIMPLLLLVLQASNAGRDVSVHREASAPTIDTPNPALDYRLELAAADSLLTLEALLALGDFDRVRARVQAVDTTAVWIASVYDYWSATADRTFLRRQWPNLTDALPAAVSDDPKERATWARAAEGLRTMARALGDNAMVRRADNLLARLPATEVRYDSADAQTQYVLHRGWRGYRMIEDDSLSASALITALLRGVVGWHGDAPHRAAALEPHMPAEWRTFRVSGLRIGRDTIAARFRREAGSYEIHVERDGPNVPLTLRLAPALPLGARVRSVIVNDHDVPVHLEESLHDTHVVIETKLDRELTIEIDYEGGVDLHAARAAISIIDFRRAARGYALTVEGMGGASHVLALRAEGGIRQVEGAEIMARTGATMLLRVSFPPAAVLVRREIFLRP